MRNAYRLVLLCAGFNFFLLVAEASAQTRYPFINRLLSSSNSIDRLIERNISPDKESVVRPRPRGSRKATMDALLYDAIIERIGIPYRSAGTDDRGYDCSGFVWRVYQEAGIDMKRGSAKMLWEMLPEIDEGDEAEFGTLVFFKDLGHVGIVRDAFSFYHVSSSKGVERAFFSGYWEDRVIGFRKVPLPKRKVRPRY